MKSRLTSLDVCVLIAEIKRYAVGMRVKKIYDVNSKCFLIKLTESNSKKIILVIESGIRIHMSDYEWTKNKIPSNFTMRLRKYIDNRRLIDAQQIGCDRIVKFTFGSGEFTVHLIVELYDRGNIILIDQNSVIIDILRKRDDGETPLNIHGLYPITNVVHVEPQITDPNTLSDYFGGITKTNDVLKVFSHDFIISNMIFKTFLLKNNVDPKLKVDSASKLDDDVLQRVFNAFQETYKICQLLRLGLNTSGYILYTTNDNSNQKLFNDFHVSLNEDNIFTDLLRDQKNILYFDSFNKTVDEYFKHTFERKSITQETNVRKKANKKLINVQTDQEKRLDALINQQENMFLRAKIIETNIETVEKCIAMTLELLNDVNWQTLGDLIKQAKKEANTSDKTLCSIISKPNYASRSITLELKLPEDITIDTLNKSPSDIHQPTSVEVFIDLNGFANAKYYYDKRKKLIEKYDKTKDSLSCALKSAEKKKLMVLKKEKIATFVQKTRKPYWFENYFWFISSDNVLVVAGRDAQQNERLVKRYMRDNDLFFHADVHGASVVIARLPRLEEDQKDQSFGKTVEQAALFAVCHSSAWDNHLAIQAYWVLAPQVSKTPPSGEYVPTGSFIISGQKNFVSPSQLSLGFGILFMSQTNFNAYNEAKSVLSLDNENKCETGIRKEDDKTTDLNQASLPDVIDENVLEPSFDNLNKGENLESEIVTPLPQKIESNEINSSNGNIPIEVAEAELTSVSLESNQTKTQNLNLTKFQINKLKKIKKKYANQDIDDRLAAIEKLHTPERITKKHIKQQKRAEEQKKLAEQREKVLSRKKVAIKKDQVNRLPDHKINDDDNKVNLITEDEIINYLSFDVSKDDQVEFILPVCGPYAPMSRYKYKLKLTPGNERRGAAFKKIIGSFIGKAKDVVVEKTAISSLKGTDLCRNMPQNVKVSYQT